MNICTWNTSYFILELLRNSLADTCIGWWAQMDSNHRPRAYQARALTTWAMSPYSYGSLSLCSPETLRLWWRWWDSNPWPPACRAGALPTELHPHRVVLLLCSSFFRRDCPWKSNNKWCLDNRFLHLRFCFDFCPADYFSQVTFSIERRWSSRTFRYGYLVTT